MNSRVNNKTKFRAFFEKPFSEKILLLQVVVLLFMFRCIILFLPFKRLESFLGEQNQKTPIKDNAFDWQYIHKLSKYIVTVSHHVPWKSECLVQAAAGKVLLRRRKIGSTIYFGVKKNDTDKKLLAHAWLKVGPEIILGGENANEYVVVSTFS